ncbi:hypothetical protein GF325_13345 [Candidatus Bathyarchaeota archaeon]|nr:hypothetical protein [Candidatus Bathyarchaeota archaeon]
MVKHRSEVRLGTDYERKELKEKGEPAFKYKPGNSLFHSLNPVSKMIGLGCMTGIVLVQDSLILLFILLLAILTVARVIGFRIIPIMKRLKWVLLFTACMIPLNILFNASSNENDIILFYVLENHEMFPIRRLAVYFTLRTAVLIFLLLMSTLIFLATTTQADLVRGMIVLGLPYTLGYSLSVALRYIPLIQHDATQVMLAQKARGLSRENAKGIMKVLRLIKERLITTLLLVLKRGQSTAKSLELRGFGHDKKRTYFKRFSWRKRDIATVVVAACCLLVAIFYVHGLLPFIPSIPSLYSILF